MSLAHFAAVAAPGRWSGRRRSTLAFIAMAWTIAAASGCGKKGPPLAPLTPIPAPAGNILVRRVDDQVFITFTVPTANRNAPGPADLARVEVYAYTALRPIPDSQIDLERDATLLRAEAVRPPEPPPPPPRPVQSPKPGEKPKPAPSPTPTRERPSGLDQGAIVTVIEQLTGEMRTPITLKNATPPIPPLLPNQGAPLGLGSEPDPMRYYVIVSVSTKGRRSNAPRSIVSLAAAPKAPATPSVTYTEQSVLIAWSPPPGVAPPPLPPPPDVLPSTPLPPPPPVLKYSVYETPPAGAPSPPTPTPLNAAPVETASIETPLGPYGVQRCFQVRAVRQIVNSNVEGPASAPACVELRDTFAPAAPANLQAVGGAGAISLIWQPNSEADLAGYLVLRADAPGATLQVLTPSPIRETTYRDTTVQPNVRYAYVVVAVDGASPPNRSAPSNRVEETAR